MDGYLTSRVRADPSFSVEIQDSGPSTVNLPDRRWHTISFYLGPATHQSVASTECNGTTELRAGEVQILPAALRHRISWSKPTTAIHLHFAPRLIEAYAPTPTLLRPSLRSQCPTLRGFGADLRACIHQPGRQAPGLVNLVDDLVRHLTAHWTEPTDAPSDPPLGQSKLNQILGLMRGPAAAETEIPALARCAGLSDRQFRARFRARIGASPKAYLVRHRIEQAKFLIWQGGLSLSSIAQEAGFFDHAHFGRTFKSLLGQSPSAYARWVERHCTL